MIKLSKDHIEAAYWLAERYLSISTVTAKTMYVKGCSFFSIRAEWTHPNTVRPRCILCQTAMKKDKKDKCRMCIHRMAERGSCSVLELSKIDCSKTIEQFVENMHDRGRYLYELLDDYHKSERWL